MARKTKKNLKLQAGRFLLGSLAVVGSGQQRQQTCACVASPRLTLPGLCLADAELGKSYQFAIIRNIRAFNTRCQFESDRSI